MKEVCIALLICNIYAQNGYDPAEPPDLPEEAKFYLEAPKAVQIHEKQCKNTLKYLHILYRHGDRNPSTLLPNDPENGESTWKEGLGEITVKGLQQQYRLGQWLRKRYGEFLGNDFSRKDIYVRSSDYSRTIMSALANLAGMFPANITEKWETSLDWVPIPVHTVDKERDFQLNEQLSCPMATAAIDSINSDPNVIKIEKAHEDLLKHLEEKSGVKKPLRLREMWWIFDALNCEFHHRETHKWPSWINESVWKRVQQLYDQSAQFSFHNKQLRRLRGGALVAEIFERLRSKINGSLEIDGPKKAYIYSAHDTTLAACLSTFGIVPHVFPLYATAVLIELHKIDGKDVIEIYYKNVTDSEALYQMEIPGCSGLCEVEALHAQLESLFPIDWYSECGRPIATSNTSLWVIIVILALMNIVCLSVICVDIVIRKQLKPRRRLPRPFERNLMADDDDEIDLEL